MWMDSTTPAAFANCAFNFSNVALADEVNAGVEAAIASNIKAAVSHAKARTCTYAHVHLHTSMDAHTHVHTHAHASRNACTMLML